MNKIAFKISNKALDDFRKIWRFIYNTWSEPQADRYYKLIIQEIEFLSQNPDYGKKYRLHQKRIS